MLFNKRTKHVIKWMWVVLSIVIILSMVITYSGFTMLPTTTSAVPTTVPQDVAQTLELDETSPVPTETLPPTEPTVPTLDFSVPVN